MLTLNDQWQLIKPVWRVLVAVGVFQIIGGVIGLSTATYGFPFIDFWYGGAVATFPGFVFGVLWHMAKSEGTLQDYSLAIAFLGLISVCLLW